MKTLCLFLGILAIPASTLAQQAEVSGYVRDPSGAAVPDAKIKIVSVDRGWNRTTSSNGDGIYSIPGLDSGKYELHAEKQGFQALVRENVVLEVAQRATVNLELKVGDVAQAVNVQAEAPLINSNDASVSTVVDRQFVENMPLNGRSFQSLIALSPGVAVTPSAETGDQGQLSVAGQRAGSNYFTIDGVSANFAAPQTRWSGQAGGGLFAFSALGSTNSLASVDALQEFRLESSTYAPEFGRESGAQVVLVTRSGTNRFHGTAFDYFRNDAFNANDWFADSTRQQKPRERQNDFGGVLGGPLLKDKTFFFFSYEGLRAAEPQFVIDDVPSLAARASAAPTMKPILNAFPLPNGPSTGVDLSQLAASVSSTASLDAASIRVDHSLSSKVSLFGRYNHSPSNVVLAACGYALSVNCLKDVKIDTGTLGVTAILSPTTTNDFHFNYSHIHSVSGFSMDSFGGAIVPPQSVLFPSFMSPSTGFSGAFPLIGRSNSIIDGRYSDHTNQQINVVDTVEIARGTHLMKFGFDFRRLTPEGRPSTVIFPYWLYGGNPMTAFVSGAPPDFMEIAQDQDYPQLIFHNFSSFAQDTWKASRRLTLTYGVRWDHNPPPAEASGNTYALSQITDLATATLLPKGSPLWRASWTNFAPRLGMSYLLSPDTSHSTVLRVGFGQFYDLGTSTASFLDNGYGWYPYSVATIFCNYGSSPGCDTPFPYKGSKPPYTFTQPYPALRGFDPHLKLPYSLEWTVALEQALSASQTFKVTYIGSVGRRLLRDEVYTNPNPIINTLYLTTNTGYSNYHALQLQFQRRLSHGLQALISYAWSHSLDTNSSDVSFVGSPSYVSPPSAASNVRLDYGNSTFDIRRSFSAAITYNIPAVNIQNSFARALLRDWSIDGIGSARTSTPFDVQYLPSLGGGQTGAGNPFSYRPDQVAGQAVYTSDPNAPGGKKLNPAAFTIPSVIRQGTEARNSIYGFPLVEIDLALRRQFNITERVHLQFRAEGFNVINHPNFGNPLSRLGTCAAGVPCTPVYGWGTSQGMLNQSLGAGGFFGSGFGSIYQVGGPRSLQLSMKLQF